jgi:hypothetical protein
MFNPTQLIDGSQYEDLVSWTSLDPLQLLVRLWRQVNANAVAGAHAAAG